MTSVIQPAYLSSRQVRVSGGARYIHPFHGKIGKGTEILGSTRHPCRPATDHSVTLHRDPKSFGEYFN